MKWRLLARAVQIAGSAASVIELVLRVLICLFFAGVLTYAILLREGKMEPEPDANEPVPREVYGEK